MDAVRIGLSIRALRRRRGWTQAQLGVHVRLSASRISRVERGQAASASIRELERMLERMLEALGARLLVRVLWQGEELDRLLDRDHARIVEAALEMLADLGWTVFPEVTFQIGRDRGSIDILAWHEATGTLLVIEVKSVVPDIQATLLGLDRKGRVAPILARDRGWAVSAVGKLLVLPDDRSARRRIAEFSATFDRALPARTAEVKRWLRAPDGPLSGVLFLSNVAPRQARQRVSRRRAGC